MVAYTMFFFGFFFYFLFCVCFWLFLRFLPCLLLFVCFQVAGGILSYSCYAFPTELSKNSHGKTIYGEVSTRTSLIGHFRVPPGLCIKTRLGAQPLIWKWYFILMQIKLISTRKVEHLTSFWYRGPGLTLKWPIYRRNP